MSSKRTEIFAIMKNITRSFAYLSLEINVQLSTAVSFNSIDDSYMFS